MTTLAVAPAPQSQVMTDEPITVTLTNDPYKSADDVSYWEYEGGIDPDLTHALPSLTMLAYGERQQPGRRSRRTDHREVGRA